MTIKGTLESFHLLDLLQMLAFNQKVGTLVLETAKGPRTVYVDNGTFGFVRTDALASRALERVLRRTSAVPADRLARGVSIAAKAGRFLGDALVELGALDEDRRAQAWNEAFRESFFDLLQSAIAKFEFYEQKILAPDGGTSTPIEPLFPVDSALLEVTRQGDEWTSLRREIPSDDEVYERTSLPADARGAEGIPAGLPERVLPLLDGRLSIGGVVDRSDCDRFSVVKYAAALLREGAIRPMTTDRIVAKAEEAVGRGEPAEAIPLLRRALERGDAHPTVRVRYADALAATGDVRGGAAELDTYAASFEGADPAGVLDALRRALEWREGDPSTAARLCDHYLRHANALRSRTHDAVSALRALLKNAAATGRATEAAARLAAFIERGDVPAEERALLAELFASAGRPVEAAQTLARRAEDLVTAGKVPAAKDALRRALSYDPSRIDVRRRLTDLEGAERRRRQRRRVSLLGLLIAVVMGSAGAVYLVSDGKAARATDDAIARASVLSRDAESRFKVLLDAWGRAVDEADREGSPDGALVDVATTFRADANRISATLRSELTNVFVDVNRRSPSSRGDVGMARMRALETAATAISARAEEAIRAVDARAERAIEAGERAYQKGVFREADPLFREAIRFSFQDAGRASRARRLLAQVEEYVGRFRVARTPFDEAVRAGATDRAWTLGVGILRELLDSDLSREIRLPVPVTTSPPGASVRVGETGALATAPTTVGYSPFDDADLRVRLPGHVAAVVLLPGYRRLRDDALAGTVTPLRVDLTLAEGPRWTSSALADGAGPFVADDALWITGPDARRLALVRPAEGTTVELRTVAPFADRVRLAGRTASATWAVLGRRTFAFAPDGGTPWQVQTSAPLERPPAFAGATIALVDESGTLDGYDAKGDRLWRTTLAAPPAQDLYVLGSELVTSTTAGEVVAVSVSDGAIRPVRPPSSGHPTLALSTGDAILVVGGAEGAATLEERKGRPVSLGATTVDRSVRPFASADAVAWLDVAGRVVVLPRGGRAPTTLSGLGACALSPVIADGVAYGVGRDGTLRAVRLDEPTRTAWACRLPGAARTAPVVLGDAVYVRTSAGLAAFDR